MIDRKCPDFFDKFAVFLGFLGLGIFFTFSFLAIGNYIEGWDPIKDSFSAAGQVIDGNKGAGFLSTGLAAGGILLSLVNLVFLRAIRDNWKDQKQPVLATGFFLVMVGRVFMMLTGAFPAGVWGNVHNTIAVAWLAGELFGLIFIASAILSKKKGVQESGRRDLVWGIVPFILIGVAIPFWVPYAMDIYDIAIPELVTASAFLGYSIALWVRVLKGKVLLGKARA